MTLKRENENKLQVMLEECKRVYTIGSQVITLYVCMHTYTIYVGI